MPIAPLLYARIDIPTLSTDPCEVTCRECASYHTSAANLQEARRIAWSHDVDHWRRRVPSQRHPTRRGRP